MDAVLEAGWTHHGHAIAGVPQDASRKPQSIKRCGGPAICADCAREAATAVIKRVQSFVSVVDDSNFVDDRHALYVGWVIGIAMRHGLFFKPVVDDDGNYTDRITMSLGESDITFVVPSPPEDWRFVPDE